MLQGNITAEEVKNAIQIQKSSKAAVLDKIHAYGGPIVVVNLIDLINLCWRMQAVPEDRQKDTIIKLP